MQNAAKEDELRRLREEAESLRAERIAKSALRASPLLRLTASGGVEDAKREELDALKTKMKEWEGKEVEFKKFDAFWLRTADAPQGGGSTEGLNPRSGEAGERAPRRYRADEERAGANREAVGNGGVGAFA